MTDEREPAPTREPTPPIQEPPPEPTPPIQEPPTEPTPPVQEPPTEPTPPVQEPPTEPTPPMQAPPAGPTPAVEAPPAEPAPAVPASPESAPVAEPRPTEPTPEPSADTAVAGVAAAASTGAVAAPPAAPAGPPVDPTADRPADGGQGRRRWLLALGVIALIVVGIVIVALLATRGGLNAVAPRYLPATTIQYLDARFDLPGDQRQEVTELLARFPGFEDASTLEAKADDTFDRILREATDGEATYTGDIKPWFGGQVAVALTGLPGVGAILEGGDAIQLPVLGMLSVKDATAAEAAMARVVTEAQAVGVAVTTAEVDGHPTWTFSDPGRTDAGTRTATVTLTNDMLIVGQDPATVAASVKLGTEGGANLAGSSAFTQATAGLPEARLATLYVDGTAIRLAAGAFAEMPELDAALQQFPIAIAGALTVRDGTITLESRVTPADGTAPLAEASSTLVSRVPGSSLAYIERPQAGADIHAILDVLPREPGVETFGVPLETIEGLLGVRLPELFDWVGDLAVVAGAGQGGPTISLVAEVIDPNAAGERVRQLQAFIQLAGIGGGVSATTTEHAGTTITTISVSQLIQDGQDVTVSFALTDDLFILGLGPESVTAVLDVTPETALAADPIYQATMSAAGPSSNAGSAYVDIRGIREAGEAFVPSEDRARYEQEIKPWLLPFDQLGAVLFQDGTSQVTQTVITTTQP